MNFIRHNEDLLVSAKKLIAHDIRLQAAYEMVSPLPLRLSDPNYASLANIIVSQMVSRASANAIWGRMLSSFGEITPERIIALDDASGRQVGLSGAKIKTLRYAAHAVLSGVIVLDDLSALTPVEAGLKLRSIKGIGPWTAEIYLMFCCGNGDIFPSGDVALQTATKNLLELPSRPNAMEMEMIAKAWAPWRSTAARLLWAYYASMNGRDVIPTTDV